MKVQGFIFNWKGHEEEALALEKQIAKLIEVTVINSEENLKEEHPGWVHLDDSAYFTAQWNRAVALFDADIFFHIQADAQINNFEQLVAKAVDVHTRYKFGVYEPNVDFTELIYNRSRLLPLEQDLAAIPIPDCTCWFIDGRIVRMLPPVDPSINYYGWGIPSAIAALCWLNGRLCIRDYAFLIRHPETRGYSNADAMQQLQTYTQNLDPEIQRGLSLLRKQVKAQIAWGPIHRRFFERCSGKDPSPQGATVTPGEKNMVLAHVGG
jgi:hypothetical protein